MSGRARRRWLRVEFKTGGDLPWVRATNGLLTGTPDCSCVWCLVKKSDVENGLAITDDAQLDEAERSLGKRTTESVLRAAHLSQAFPYDCGCGCGVLASAEDAAAKEAAMSAAARGKHQKEQGVHLRQGLVLTTGPERTIPDVLHANLWAGRQLTSFAVLAEVTDKKTADALAQKAAMQFELRHAHRTHEVL